MKPDETVKRIFENLLTGRPAATMPLQCPTCGSRRQEVRLCPLCLLNPNHGMFEDHPICDDDRWHKAARQQNIRPAASARDRLLRAIDLARRSTASDPQNLYCRQATLILDAAYKDEAGNAEGGPAASAEKPKYAVGVSVLLTRGSQLLLGKRKNVSAAGLYSTPGGRIEGEGWISVKERLPDGGLVLAFVPPNIMGVAYQTSTNKLFMWPDVPDDREAIGVTHWMPLPDPPQEGKS